MRPPTRGTRSVRRPSIPRPKPKLKVRISQAKRTGRR